MPPVPRPGRCPCLAAPQVRQPDLPVRLWWLASWRSAVTHGKARSGPGARAGGYGLITRGNQKARLSTGQVTPVWWPGDWPPNPVRPGLGSAACDRFVPRLAGTISVRSGPATNLRRAVRLVDIRAVMSDQTCTARPDTSHRLTSTGVLPDRPGPGAGPCDRCQLEAVTRLRRRVGSGQFSAPHWRWLGHVAAAGPSAQA